jgi:hypothetical protein
MSCNIIIFCCRIDGGVFPSVAVNVLLGVLVMCRVDGEIGGASVR